jgi:hypothetical protein
VERSAGEKKMEGSGRTVDWIRGKRNGPKGWICGGGDSDMIGISGGGRDGGGVGGLRRLLFLENKVVTFRSTFFNIVRKYIYIYIYRSLIICCTEWTSCWFRFGGWKGGGKLLVLWKEWGNGGRWI